MYGSLVSAAIGAFIGGLIGLVTSALFFMIIGLSNPVEQRILLVSFILVMMILGATVGWEFGKY